MIFDSVNGKGAILDAIGVTTDNCAKVGVAGFCVGQILLGIVISQHHILILAPSIVDEDRDQARSVWDVFNRDIRRTDGVDGEVVICDRSTRSSGMVGQLQSRQCGGEVAFDMHPVSEDGYDEENCAASKKQRAGHFKYYGH